MRVRYFTQAAHPWGREEPTESELDLDELPPLAKRVLERDGIEGLLRDFHYWEGLGIKLWFWVRPL